MARAQFAAYFTDLRDEELDIASAAAQDASPRDVILHVLEEERRALGLSDEDLSRDCSEGRELGNLQPRGAR